jgi:hypothetical protein
MFGIYRIDPHEQGLGSGAIRVDSISMVTIVIDSASRANGAPLMAAALTINGAPFTNLI